MSRLFLGLFLYQIGIQEPVCLDNLFGRGKYSLHAIEQRVCTILFLQCYTGSIIYVVETELHIQSHIIHIEDGSISIIALHVYSFENFVYESCSVFKVFGVFPINFQYSVFAEGFLVQWERYIGIEGLGAIRICRISY